MQSGKDLNFYEIASTYNAYGLLDVWMDICPNNSTFNKIQEHLLDNKIINKPYRITFDFYTDDASMYLNGTTITLIDYISEDFGNQEPFIFDKFRINAYYDYKPGIITFKSTKYQKHYLIILRIKHPTYI